MEERLKSIIERAVPGIDTSKITRESRLVEDLGFDSLALMMMAMGIEDAFGYRFTEFIKFEKVCDVLDFLADKI